MTLHTVQVDLKPDDTLKVFRGLEERGNEESWDLLQLTADRVSVTFEVCVQGSPTPMQVALNQDGTWSASTHISLGEKL